MMAMRLSRSIVGKEEAEAVSKVICEDGYLGMGSVTRQFEKEIANYLGIMDWQAISVNSGTAALHLACEAIKTSLEEKGKIFDSPPEILVPTLTFVASFQAIRAAGCKPVPCDVLLSTGTIDLEDAKTRITSNTVAVMHVDYASNPWQISKVYDFAAAYGLRVIDDAAHAFGCKFHGRKIGSFGDIVCFSFDGIKNITCGEGGLLAVFDEQTATITSDSRLLGVEGDTQKRFSGARTWNPDVKRQGWRYHLSNIMAAIGRVQLSRLENEFIPARRKLWEQYKTLLNGCPHLELLKTDPEDFIVPHIMPVRVLNGLKNQVIALLENADIPTGIHYKPNHLLSYFGNNLKPLKNAELLYDQLVTLPLHPGLTCDDIKTVCSLIINFLETK